MPSQFLSQPSPDASLPDSAGRFGQFGGRFVPETLVAALDQLEREYLKAKQDPEFQAQLDELLRDFVGRPSPLYFARRLMNAVAGHKSGSSGKILIIRVLTRSIARWVKRC